MIRYNELIAAPAPRSTKRIAYGSGPQQFGDLWLPSNAPLSPRKRATIVFIHGGCWESEYSLDHAAYAASALSAAGYVVWLPEYRRLGDAGGGWPGTFDDIAAAVDFLRRLAETEPMINRTRVIAAGHSAGGQLALWVASRRDDASRASIGRNDPLALVGVVTLAAITDLAVYGAASGSCNASVTRLLGGRPSDVRDRYSAVSPVERLPIGVPMRLVHGELDPIVPIAMMTDFAIRAEAAGDRADVTTITSAGHFDLVAPQTRAWSAVMAAFQGISPPL